MRMKTLVAALVAAGMIQVGLSTKQIDQASRALTDAGYWGAPRYATASLPTCNGNETGALAYDTTDSALVVCDGSSWVNALSTPFVNLLGAYWGLDDQFFGATANYESKVADNSLDLTPTNDPLRAPYANRLPAAQFVDGSSEYLSVADPWTSGDIDFSVGCWVYLDDLTGDLPIASKDDGTQREWRLYYDDNTTDAWVFEIFDGAGGSRGTVSKTTPAPAATTWFFVVGAHDATNNEVGVSVNGSAYTTAATSGAAVDTDDPFELGRMGAATYHDGRLSQCFFIKEELSAADLGDLYNNGIPVPSRQFAARVATAAEGLWDLSGLSGTRADFTANAVTLTDNASVLHGAGLAPRAYNGALFVAAENDYLVNSSGSHDAVEPATEDFSVEFWVRSTTATTEFLLDNGGSLNTEAGYQILLVDGTPDRVHCRVSDGTGIVAGEWAQIVMTVDRSGNMICYENGSAGTPANVSSGTPGSLANSHDLTISAASSGITGTAGPVRVWVGTVLTSTQITKLRAGGQAFSCDSLPPDLPTPDECWDLDEPSGTRTGSIAGIELTDTNTVLSGEGIADIPGGVTLRAADFETSTSEYLSRSSEAQFVAGDSDFTWWAWVRTESATNGVVFGKTASTATASEAEWFMWYASALRCSVSTGSAIASATDTATIALEQWYLWTCVHDASADLVKASTNGGNFVTQATGGALSTDSEGIGVGSTSDGDVGRFWDGEIASVGWLSGTAFTQAQVQLLYNSGDALRCEDIEDVVGVAPTVCWDLDEASGTRSAAIGTADLTDNNTVLSTGGLIRGRTGHAVRFTGSAGEPYLTLADTTEVQGGEQDFTYVVWARDDATSESNLTLLSKSNASTACEYFARRSDGATVMNWDIRQGGAGCVQVGAAAEGVADAPLGEWHMWVFEYEAGTAVRHYVVDLENTAEDTTLSGSAGTTSQAFTIGSRAQGDFNWIGPVDEVFRFDGILTETQRDCLYNSGLGRSYADLTNGDCDE